MGLIKSLATATKTTFADQWKEFFYCDAIPAEILMVKGVKQVASGSSNKKGTDNIITNGSGIAVADGQCMLIVDQGKVVEVCAEPGEYTFNASSEPSIFTGKLGTGILDTFKTIGKRFTYGGDTGKNQRVYYLNTKEIMGNKYGTPNPVPFRVVDKNIGLDVDIAIRCNGEYSYRITDPILFYTNVCGNVDGDYGREMIDSQLKSELMTALQPAFGRISEMGIRYSSLSSHAMEMADALNDILSSKWKSLRGIEVVSFGINSATASKEDEDMIKELQRRAVMRDPGMAAATMTEAQAEAMKMAASNEATGPMFAFAGMNMANQVGGMNAGQLFQMSQQQQANQTQMNQGQMGQPQGMPAGQLQQSAGSWTCSCGTVNTGNFCCNCGSPKKTDWTCSCGAVNTGNFCSNCGKRRV